MTREQLRSGLRDINQEYESIVTANRKEDKTLISIISPKTRKLFIPLKSQKAAVEPVTEKSLTETSESIVIVRKTTKVPPELIESSSK